MKNEMDISGLGPVNFTRSFKARYLRITIKSDETVTVTIPRNGTIEEAKRFLQLKLLWIEKQLQKIKQYAQVEKTIDSNIDIEKAQQGLFDRLVLLSKHHNFSFNRITFRCQKTKWGSCSAKNNINLNVNIAFLPAPLQDYILLHELCHIRHKNHSRNFWSELDKYTNGNAKKLSEKIEEIQDAIILMQNKSAVKRRAKYFLSPLDNFCGLYGL